MGLKALEVRVSLWVIEQYRRAIPKMALKEIAQIPEEEPQHSAGQIQAASHPSGLDGVCYLHYV